MLVRIILCAYEIYTFSRVYGWEEANVLPIFQIHLRYERDHRSRRTLYLACLPGSLKWWSSSIQANEWPQCHCSHYLTCDFRKSLNKQYILSIASANSSLTIRLFCDTQHKLWKNCVTYSNLLLCWVWCWFNQFA